MAKKSRKKKRLATLLVPRAGPPTNLRPGGFHKDRRRERRAEIKSELRQIDVDQD
jgi:hypothetical protein